MTLKAIKYRTAVVHALRDARDELDREDFATLLEFVTAALAHLVSESWERDPDRPEGWTS